ncbi:MAG: ribonuclease M5 [Firmicutes bacterium]|nr:ribonuclease M5 [Bacillota bacterium]
MEDFVKEVIIVEGRDDIDAVQKAVNADVIATHGYGISRATIKRIDNAYKTRGIIILTDPDHAGNRIRQRLTEMFPQALQAYISRQDALDKTQDIGVENAKPEVIERAVAAAGRTLTERRAEFDENDMVYYGLAGGADSRALRDRLGRKLGIGYGNAKAFLKRLNNYGILREDLERELSGMSEAVKE